MLIVWIGITAVPVCAQQYNFRHYSVEEGLAQSEVRTIRQDPRGYLWMGTFGGGVSRFDGMHFEHYDTDRGLLNQEVSSILADRQGNLWFGHIGAGLAKYDGHRFTYYGKSDGLEVPRDVDLMEDRMGNLWFGCEQKGLYRFDGIHFQLYGAEQDLTQWGASSPIQRLDGSIWFGTDRGVCRVKGDTLKDFSNLPGAPVLHVEVLAEDQDSLLWIGAKEGLFTFNGETFIRQDTFKPLAPVHHILFDSKDRMWVAGQHGLAVSGPDQKLLFFDQKELARTWVNVVFEDRDGNIWVGTGGEGVLLYGGDQFVHYGEQEGLDQADIYAILPKEDGSLLLGTKFGLRRFSDHRFSHLPEADAITQSYVISLDEDSKGRVWAAAITRLLRIEGEKARDLTYGHKIDSVNVVGVNVDAQDRVWVSSTSGLFRIEGDSVVTLSETDDRFGEWTNRVLVDSKSRLWVLTNSKGLLLVEGDSVTSFGLEQVLPHLKTTDIQEDENGNLWIGTFEGLARYREGEFCYLSHREGLSNDLIYSLSLDKSGSLWAATARGLNRIELNENSDPQRIYTYGKGEGFPAMECNQGASEVDFEGDLWFGHIEGLTRFRKTPASHNIPPPAVVLDEVLLFLEKSDWGQYSDSLTPWNHLPTTLSLSHQQNHLRFNFSAITSTFPEKVSFRYQLEGLETDWSPATRERNAVYSNLSPGDYTFLVTAANHEGGWNPQPARFSFSIRAPFWQTAWFF